MSSKSAASSEEARADRLFVLKAEVEVGKRLQVAAMNAGAEGKNLNLRRNPHQVCG